MHNNYFRERREGARSPGRLLFSGEEGVNAATNPLVRIIRAIFYHEGITSSGFMSMFNKFWQRERRDPTKRQGQRYNTLRTLQKVDKVTWVAFEQAVLRVLRFEIVDVSITLRRTDGGETFRISSSMIARDDGLFDPITNELHSINVSKDLIESTRALVAAGNDEIISPDDNTDTGG